MSDERELPPKSLSTQASLTAKRHNFTRDLSMYCVNDRGCHDLARAKDLLRSHTCSIFDTLKDAYSNNRVNLWEWEKEIAEEAIQITHACWNNFRDLPEREFSSKALLEDIQRHVGHPLRSGPLLKAFIAPPESESPLLVMAKAAALGQHVFAPAPIQSKRVPRSIQSMSAVEKMEQYRERMGLGQTDLASRFQVDPKTLYKFRKTGKIDKRIASSIAEKMEITLEEFIGNFPKAPKTR